MYILNCKVKLLATVKKIKDSLDDKKFNTHEVDSLGELQKWGRWQEAFIK